MEDPGDSHETPAFDPITLMSVVHAYIPSVTAKSDSLQSGGLEGGFA